MIGQTNAIENVNNSKQIINYKMLYNSGDESVEVTGEDDWQTLANLAGITATSIEEVLINSETLLSNENAVLFMVHNCTGNFMLAAIQSDTFLNALNNSPFKTIIYANEHWSKFLTMVA